MKKYRSLSQRRSINPATSARGFLMLEALVALLIFAMAALALVGLQTSMMRAQTGAKFRGDATFLAADLIGTIWADNKNFDKYMGSDCATHAPCKAWTDRVAAALPSGEPTISPAISGNGKFDLSITWKIPGEGQHKFETSATISANAPSTL